MTKVLYRTFGQNRKTEYGYGLEERLESAQLPGGKTVTYEYDGFNRMIQRKLVTYEYEAPVIGKTSGRLSRMINGGTALSFGYNSDGLWLHKTVGTTRTDYEWDGSALLAEQTGNNKILYLYDGTGLIGFKRNGVTYTYVYNGLGDVMEILDKDGNAVVSYLYDAWGAPISITGPMASTLGVQNPIRYRGYYYDTETGLYYLQSRYYDPVVGRFINADGYVSTGQGILGTNMFAYCGNNPVSRFDVSGCNWLDALKKTILREDQWRKLENAKYGSPVYGEPNSWLHIPSSGGNNDIDRYFGPDGRAQHDVHWGHAGHHPGIGSPHTEDWKWDGDHPTLDPGSARPYDPNKDGAPPASNPVPQPSQGTNIQIDPQAAAIVATTIMVIGGIAMLLLTGDPSALSHAFA